MIVLNEVFDPSITLNKNVCHNGTCHNHVLEKFPNFGRVRTRDTSPPSSSGGGSERPKTRIREELVCVQLCLVESLPGPIIQ